MNNTDILPENLRHGYLHVNPSVSGAKEAARGFAFPVGAAVRKVTGDYAFDGIVVAALRTLSGQERFVVEHREHHMLHIFSAKNLTRERDEAYVSARTEDGAELTCMRKAS